MVPLVGHVEAIGHAHLAAVGLHHQDTLAVGIECQMRLAAGIERIHAIVCSGHVVGTEPIVECPLPADVRQRRGGERALGSAVKGQARVGGCIADDEGTVGLFQIVADAVAHPLIKRIDTGTRRGDCPRAVDAAQGTVATHQIPCPRCRTVQTVVLERHRLTLDDISVGRIDAISRHRR